MQRQLIGIVFPHFRVEPPTDAALEGGGGREGEGEGGWGGVGEGQQGVTWDENKSEGIGEEELGDSGGEEGSAVAEELYRGQHQGGGEGDRGEE